ncbi:MAG: amidohydrolase family protein [Sandarakinorhabdus sp.]|nr:amidohydrolase family protein [Sandarakinorhabdus sp.]
MLIRGAEVEGRRCDVRIGGGVIAAMAADLVPLAGEPVVEAAGGALVPGLHDHHIHLDATAAALASVKCGPPEVSDREALARALASVPGAGWLRGVGYHDSIGWVDRAWLDAHGPARPVRIQHRGGRMWVLNSRAMALVGAGVPADGRLIDGDPLVAARLGRVPPDLAGLGQRLAALGITGVTEVTPRNGAADFARYAAAGMAQNLLVMGGAALDAQPPLGRARRGAVKLHYHDHDLPGLAALADEVARAHAAGRPVAAHCVTRGELLLTLAAIEVAGAHAGDRIEHAGVAPDEAVEWVSRLGLTVVTQPHFLAERAAAYRTEVDAADRPYLYRLQAWRDAGVRLAGGSDAPFGGSNPWAAMAAAVDRPAGFGAGEALTPEAALGLFLGDPEDPGGPARRVAVGAAADLCLIDSSWIAARRDLAAVRVRATMVAGLLKFDRRMDDVHTGWRSC